MAISSYEIALKSVTEQRPLSEKLAHVHNVICERLPSIKRIAVAIYDAKSDLLKTFVHSTDGENPLSRYQASMSEAPSLQSLTAMDSEAKAVSPR